MKVKYLQFLCLPLTNGFKVTSYKDFSVILTGGRINIQGGKKDILSAEVWIQNIIDGRWK